jgi:hypothetical protein
MRTRRPCCATIRFHSSVVGGDAGGEGNAGDRHQRSMAAGRSFSSVVSVKEKAASFFVFLRVNVDARVLCACAAESFLCTLVARRRCFSACRGGCIKGDPPPLRLLLQLFIGGFMWKEWVPSLSGGQMLHVRGKVHSFLFRFRC